MKYFWIRLLGMLLTGAAVLYVAWDVWMVRDPKFMRRDLAFAAFCAFMLGLLFWLGSRWDHYRRARSLGIASLAGIYGCGILAIGFWADGSSISALVMTALAAWGLIDLVRAVTKGEPPTISRSKS